jgi:hypothetical protein
MKLSDIVSRIEIDPRKLTEYALNPDNPVGADKIEVPFAKNMTIHSMR